MLLIVGLAVPISAYMNAQMDDIRYEETLRGN